MPKRIHREDGEQKALIQWADITQLPGAKTGVKIGNYLFAIPNGGARSRIEAARLIGLGVRRGVSDLMFAWPVCGFHGLFIEMKATSPHDSPVSEYQKAFLERMSNAGFAVAVCPGFAAGKDDILYYLEGTGFHNAT